MRKKSESFISVRGLDYSWGRWGIHSEGKIAFILSIKTKVIPSHHVILSSMSPTLIYISLGLTCVCFHSLIKMRNLSSGSPSFILCTPLCGWFSQMLHKICTVFPFFSRCACSCLNQAEPSASVLSGSEHSCSQGALSCSGLQLTLKTGARRESYWGRQGQG